MKDAFGGPFREIPLEDHLGALGGLYDGSHGLDFYGVRRYVDGRSPGPGGGDREEPPHRRLAGPLAHLRRHAGGADHRAADPAGTAPEGPSRRCRRSRPSRRRPSSTRSSTASPRPRPSPARLSSPQDGEVVFEAARGIADRNHGVPMRLDSKLNLGSMNKMFTAVVIGQLVDEGKLSFQDPVSKFLGGKGWTKADLSKVRVEHLLSHTSGLGSYFNDDLPAHGAAAPAEGRRLQAARGRGDARLRAGDEVAVQQHGLPARRRGDRGGHREGLLRRRPRARLREGGHAGQRLLRHRPRRPEPGRSATRASGRRGARSGARTRSSTSSAAGRPAAATRPRGTSWPSPRRCGRGSS